MSETNSTGKNPDESGLTEAQSEEIAHEEAQRMADALGDSVSEIKIEWFGERSCHFIIVEYRMAMSGCSGVYEAQIINTVLQSDAAVQVDSTCNGDSAIGFIPSQFAGSGHFVQAGGSA